jgi:hypothetical protein
VTANAYSDDVSLLANNGNGTFTFLANYSIVDRGQAVVAKDLDQDDDLDLVVMNQNGECVSILFNNGDATFGGHVAYPVGSWPHWLFVADLDGDTHPDIVTTNQGSDSISVLLNDGNAGFANRTDYQVGSHPRGVHVADFDLDGDPDIAVANFDSRDASVLLNDGAANFAPQLKFATNPGCISVFAADLDNDGDTDLQTANFYADTYCILENLVSQQTNPWSLVEPDTVYVFQAHSLEPLEGAVYLGDFPQDYTASDVDLSSILINGEIVPLSTSVLPSHPSFQGEVCRSSMFLGDFILYYGFLCDASRQELVVTGQFADAMPFLAEGQFTLIGHTSGDVDLSGRVDIADLIFLVEFIFVGGPPPQVISAGDVNGSGGVIDISDLVYLIEYMFQDGPEPPPCS